ncbi:hypothetical protein K402DRAFT_371856 [Aulographum hederae CBS 113979]|uniref:MHD domain-containing protein n=1 Tax=Aulographum hederae CBS 113979 TaxID=1176131 RepID=A0A6G1HA64_9PEZI|nr:hypothetical protein K402DRAFT_371856 [Aulographum hederae CBS 113979]
MSAVEALYIFDEHNNCILEHVWTGRPPAAKTLLPLYLAHSAPRPPLIYLPDTNPASLVHSMIQDRLLFLSPSSQENEPLLVLEFLHRVADAFEDFLGSPLLASKIESSYDVVAQLLGEMCDGGTIATTEPNALHDAVETPGWMNKLSGLVGLPGAPPSLSSSSTSFKPSLNPASSTPTIPWRRANVRHTSNEIYVDMVETLTVIMSPSGKPLCARANGTIAFTAKVSGIPDLLLGLTSSAGSKANLGRTMQLPVFHPCVRLARWKERPGELSFVPPDGRFVLAGYEVDLLGEDYLERAVATKGSSKTSTNLHLPLSVEMRTGLGVSGTEFEARLMLDTRFPGNANTSSGGSGPSARGSGGTSSSPQVDDILITIPVPSNVRNISDLRPSRGEAHYAPGDGALEWRIAGKAAAALVQGLNSSVGLGATLRCTVVGPLGEEDGEGIGGANLEVRGETWEYDEDTGGSAAPSSAEKTDVSSIQTEQRLQKKMTQNATLMPSSASVSFQVKGWLASGIKVERLVIDTQRSRGLGAGVTPYKGVKYLTVSRGGVEVRC